MAGSIPAAAGRIFLSYRREETAYPAGWLYDRLADRYGDGQVFKDVDSIQLGDDFVEVITAAVGSCDVLLALIGEEWLSITDALGRRRLDDPDDFVRLEIEAALTRNVRVIPILVDGARMPRADELPDSLARLVRRQALELSPNRFDFDTSRLLKVLDKTLVEVRTGEHDAAALRASAAEAPSRAPVGDAASRSRDAEAPSGPSRAPGPGAPLSRAPAAEAPSRSRTAEARSGLPPWSTGTTRPQRQRSEGRQYLGGELATWWQRAGAHLLDLLIVAVPFMILSQVEPYSALLVTLVIWLYNRSYLQGKDGQSWGKRAFRLRLVRMADRRPIGGGAALVRNLAHALDLATLGVGYLLPLWDANRQTLADKVMKTIVIVQRKPQASGTVP